MEIIHNKSTWVHDYSDDFSILSKVEDGEYPQANLSIRDGRDYINLYLSLANQRGVDKVDKLIAHLKELRDAMADVLEQCDNKD